MFTNLPEPDNTDFDAQEELYDLASKACVCVLASENGAWATNEHGVVAFESLAAARDAAIERNAEVEVMTLDELVDLCHAEGMAIVWVRAEGPALVLRETVFRWPPRDNLE